MPDITSSLPYSESCERNKQPIFDILQPLATNARLLLEIGSGTGQHACWMAQQLSQLQWQPSEIPAELEMLNVRLSAEAPSNVLPAIALDVSQSDWTDSKVDILYTANTLHIMSAGHVKHFWSNAGLQLSTSARVVVYGPFKYEGHFTTPSNANFDLWLKQRDPVSGVRDFEWINELADTADFDLIDDHAMPANNQCVIWQKR